MCKGLLQQMKTCPWEAHKLDYWHKTQEAYIQRYTWSFIVIVFLLSDLSPLPLLDH